MSDSAGLLRELAAVLGWRRETVVMTLYGFFDESGEHGVGGKLNRLTLGGFFAPWDAVQSFRDDWQKALEDEGLREFHMKEIASDEQTYQSWEPARKNRFDRFLGLMCKHAVGFAACSYVPQKSSERPFRDTYLDAIHRVFEDAFYLAAERGEKVHVVFARSQEISQWRIDSVFEKLWLDRMSGYSVINSSDSECLQAAEFVVRGFKRVLQDGTVTESLARILTAHKPFKYWPMDPVSASGSVWRYRGEAIQLC